MTDIPTWRERAMTHPDHQSGMVSEGMIRARMAEEIADLRAEVERLTRDRAMLLAEVERLRAQIVSLEATGAEAADEIDRLRATLTSIAANTCCEECQEAKRVARSALEVKL